MPESVEVVEETVDTAAKKAPKSVAKLEEEGDIAADYLEALLDIGQAREPGGEEETIGGEDHHVTVTSGDHLGCHGSTLPDGQLVDS